MNLNVWHMALYFFWNKILCVREASNFSVNISYMPFASAMVGELQTCVELIQIQHSEHIN